MASFIDIFYLNVELTVPIRLTVSIVILLRYLNIVYEHILVHFQCAGFESVSNRSSPYIVFFIICTFALSRCIRIATVYFIHSIDNFMPMHIPWQIGPNSSLSLEARITRFVLFRQSIILSLGLIRSHFIAINGLRLCINVNTLISSIYDLNILDITGICNILFIILIIEIITFESKRDVFAQAIFVTSIVPNLDGLNTCRRTHIFIGKEDLCKVLAHQFRIGSHTIFIRQRISRVIIGISFQLSITTDLYSSF